MKKKNAKLSEIADPAITQIFAGFLAEQRKRLKPKTFLDYENIIRLFTDYMNGYAHQGLSKSENALFEKLYNAEGKDHREFCEIFGPEKITDELGGFLGVFMVRNVIAGGDFKRLAGTVAKKLSKWLAEKGYISLEDAAMGAEEGASAAADLPKAEKAAHIIYTASENVIFDPDELDDENYHEFDHYAIEKVEQGNLWLEGFDDGKGKFTVGPIAVPKEAAGLLQKGWNISCAIARIKGRWKIVEFGNIYPL